VYVNTQQEEKDFINDWWKTTGGSRSKAPGVVVGLSPRPSTAVDVLTAIDAGIPRNSLTCLV
jgi:hypothetical protein